MRAFWSSLLAVVVIGPAAMVVLLLSAAQFPELDGFTLNMPMGLRAMVSQMALRQAGDDSRTEGRIYRVIQLDPENEPAWSRLCGLDRSADPSADPKAIVTICRKALSLRSTAWSFHWLGLALEQTGDYCGAEEALSSAIAMKRDSPVMLRNMGLASLRCGHAGAAASAFEQAESLDAASATEDVADAGEPRRQAGDAVADGLTEDRELLMLAYNRAGLAEKASVLCAEVHPGWASCSCALSKYGASCVDGAGRR